MRRKASPKSEPEPVHVRWMTRNDLAAVLAASDTVGDGITERDYLQWLRERNCMGVVAEHGDTIRGHMVYELQKYSLHLLRFIVHRKRRGVGTALVNRLKAKLSTHRRTHIIALVPERLLELLLFLKGQGFRAESVDRHAEAICMVYRIAEDPIEQNRIAACW